MRLTDRLKALRGCVQLIASNSDRAERVASIGSRINRQGGTRAFVGERDFRPAKDGSRLVRDLTCDGARVDLGLKGHDGENSRNSKDESATQNPRGRRPVHELSFELSPGKPLRQPGD